MTQSQPQTEKGPWQPLESGPTSEKTGGEQGYRCAIGAGAEKKAGGWINEGQVNEKTSD